MPNIPLRRNKIKGVEVDSDLANAVFLDDILEQLRQELEASAISVKSLLSVVVMVVPAMAGTILTMFANLQIALLQYFGNYTLGDMLTWTIAFYLGVSLGPLISIVVYLLVAHWALSSFQGIVVIRVVARNPTGSKTYVLDYMGEPPKPMRKPRLDELGSRFTAFMREEISKLQKGVPLFEIQDNIEKMQNRFAESYYKQMEKLKAAQMKTVSRTVLVIKRDDATGNPILDDEGQPLMEEMTVQVPVFKASRSRLYRILWATAIIGLSLLTLFIINWVVFSLFHINLFKIIFGFLPIWG